MRYLYLVYIDDELISAEIGNESFVHNPEAAIAKLNEQGKMPNKSNITREYILLTYDRKTNNAILQELKRKINLNQERHKPRRFD